MTLLDLMSIEDLLEFAVWVPEIGRLKLQCPKGPSMSKCQSCPFFRMQREWGGCYLAHVYFIRKKEWRQIEKKLAQEQSC